MHITLIWEYFYKMIRRCQIWNWIWPKDVKKSGNIELKIWNLEPEREGNKTKKPRKSTILNSVKRSKYGKFQFSKILTLSFIEYVINWNLFWFKNCNLLGLKQLILEYSGFIKDNRYNIVRFYWGIFVQTVFLNRSSRDSAFHFELHA